LRDRNPSGITPWVVYGIIVINVLVFMGEASMSEEGLNALTARFGLVPAEVTQAVTGKGSLLQALIVPMLTSMFLHGGWLHLLGNMWFLYIFADNVEGRLGRGSFALFYVLCGVVALATEYLLRPNSPLPVIGASGAIAGVLGAYVVCWPKARVLCLVPFFYFLHFVELPAVIALGMWFLIQFLQGAASLGAPFAHGGVAYGAHVGGFVAGIILIKVWPHSERPQRPRSYNRWSY